jgi:hypothetical protein
MTASALTEREDVDRAEVERPQGLDRLVDLLDT